MLPQQDSKKPNSRKNAEPRSDSRLSRIARRAAAESRRVTHPERMSHWEIASEAAGE
jgi:hypothetical protein